MKRIVFCNGIGNLTYQSAALFNKKEIEKSENILFLITEYNLPKTQRLNCLNIAKISRLFGEVYDLGDIISDFHYPDPIIQELAYKKVLNKLKRFLKHSVVQEIWLYKLDSSFMQFIMNQYLNADIIFTDNGLASYREIPLITSSKEKKYQADGIFESHIARLKKIFMTIPEKLPIPNYMLSSKSETLNIQHFSEYFNILLKNKYIKKLIKEIVYLPDMQNVLIVGSAFYRLDITTKSEERNIYKALIQKLLKKGYQVFWKSHPRDEYIDLHLPKRVIRLNENLPIELYAYQIKFNTVISISSSALLILEKLFNVESLYVDIKFQNKDKIPRHIKQLRNILKKYYL